jgi:eukaryotic-like serine/threonine-protein kinase
VLGPFARPYVGLVVAYAAAGQPAQARRLLAEYRATRPEEVRNRLEPYLEGYVALAEHRPQEEIAAFRQVVEQRECNTCGFWELALAFDQAGQRDSALVAYERVATEPWLMNEVSYYQEWTLGVTLAPSLRRMGELYDARGDREKAVEYYGRFVDLWKEADPALQPAVREVKARLSQHAGGH